MSAAGVSLATDGIASDWRDSVEDFLASATGHALKEFLHARAAAGVDRHSDMATVVLEEYLTRFRTRALRAPHPRSRRRKQSSSGRRTTRGVD